MTDDELDRKLARLGTRVEAQRSRSVEIVAANGEIHAWATLVKASALGEGCRAFWFKSETDEINPTFGAALNEPNRVSLADFAERPDGLPKQSHV